jgi:hypothetical protein
MEENCIGSQGPHQTLVHELAYSDYRPDGMEEDCIGSQGLHQTLVHELAYSDYRPDGMEKNCIGSQDQQWTVVLEEEEEKIILSVLVNNPFHC